MIAQRHNPIRKNATSASTGGRPRSGTEMMAIAAEEVDLVTRTDRMMGVRDRGIPRSLSAVPIGRASI
jgi:hypothetical protein